MEWQLEQVGRGESTLIGSGVPDAIITTIGGEK